MRKNGYNRIRGSSSRNGCCRTPDLEYGASDLNNMLGKLEDFVEGGGGDLPTPINQQRGKTVEVNSDIEAEEKPREGDEIGVIYNNTGEEEFTVTISAEKYRTPEGNDIVLVVPVGGYAEANFLNIKGTIYARGC